MYLEDFPAGTNICVSVEDTGKASFGRLCTLTVSQDHKKYLNQNRATRTNKNARILKKQGSLFGLFKKNKFKETSVFLCEQSEWLTLAEEKSFPGSFAIGKYKWKHSSPSAYSSHSMWTPLLQFQQDWDCAGTPSQNIWVGAMRTSSTHITCRLQRRTF